MFTSFNFKAVVFALSTWLVSSSAFATHYSGQVSFFTKLHFTATAFGKPVAGVYAHVGAHTHSYSHGDYWANVQHLPMSLDGDHFVAKTIVAGERDSNSPNATGVIVQYWVYFQDGTSLITDSVDLPTTRWRQYSLSSEADEYDQDLEATKALWQDAEVEQSEAEAVEGGHVG